MRWTQQEELQLVMLALAQAPTFTINADKIRQGWPSNQEKPSHRAIKDRISKLRKLHNIDFKTTVSAAATVDVKTPTVNRREVNNLARTPVKIKPIPGHDTSTSTTSPKNHNIVTPIRTKIVHANQTPKSVQSSGSSSSKKRKREERKFRTMSDDESAEETQISSEESEEEAVMSNAEDDDEDLMVTSTSARRQLPTRQTRRPTLTEEVLQSINDQETPSRTYEEESGDDYDPARERQERIREHVKAAKRSRRFVLGDDSD